MIERQESYTVLVASSLARLPASIPTTSPFFEQKCVSAPESRLITRSHRWLGAVSSGPANKRCDLTMVSFHTNARTHTCTRIRWRTHGHASKTVRRSAPARPRRAHNGRRPGGTAASSRPADESRPRSQENRIARPTGRAPPSRARRQESGAGLVGAPTLAVGSARCCCCFQPRSRETHRSGGGAVGWAAELSLRAVRAVGSLRRRSHTIQRWPEPFARSSDSIDGAHEHTARVSH